MLNIFDELACQLFHDRWAKPISYSRQGAWMCTKPGCRAQARQWRHLATADVPTAQPQPKGAISRGRVRPASRSARAA